MEHEDGLTHFCWKAIGSDATNIEPIDLIIFGGDANFEPVIQSPGRIFVLRFTSSSARHFFWLQDVSTDQNDARVRRINQLINDPFAPPPQVGPLTSTDGDVQMGESSGSNSTEVELSTHIQDLSRSDQLRSILDQFSTMGQENVEESVPFTLYDTLAPSALNSLLDSLPQDVLDDLSNHLPPSVPHDRESLVMAINSLEFRRSVAGLDSALRTGALGPLMTAFGLPASAANGVEEFIKAIQDQADSTSDNDATMG